MSVIRSSYLNKMNGMVDQRTCERSGPMFHVILILFPLILCGIILPILLFGLSSILISIFGGTASALLIKNKKARSLLFISFTILSLLGVLCLFPFVAIYTPLPFSYYPFFCNVLIALMGVFSILGITSSRSIQNNLIKRVVIVLFSIVVGIVGIVFLLQIL